MIICPETNLQNAMNVAKNINLSIKNHTFETYKKEVTVSIGVATFDNEIIKPEDMISRADKALYQAKDAGRDKVIAFS